MGILSQSEPAEVLGFFEDICGIPHISYHEQEISDYCVEFAKERGLYYEQDELGNVIIIGEATEGYEDVEPIMIQGHLDMVGDKLPDCPIDMEREAIKVMIDGDFITADGTTLGGDNGIAVAYALALLDAKDIPHPRLEVVLTVSEEVGLIGATAIDLSCCKAKRLLNIDSEEEGVFTAGCAGGVRADCEISVESVEKEGILCVVRTKGLLGGHSGIEINRGRVNGNVVIGRFLLQLKKSVAFDLISMIGGVKDNVIPKNASTAFLVAEADVDAVKAVVSELNQSLDAEYGTADPDVELVLEVKEKSSFEVLTEEAKNKAITAVNVLPNGVQAMSMDLPGLVETSLNMGVMSVDKDGIKLCFSIRSAHASAKDYLGDQLILLTESLGGTVSFRGEYPGWPYARESKLRDLCLSVYQEQYGKEAKVEVIHAGLECGILSDKVPGLDCISMGPDMYDVHTPDERISIASVARVWKFIKAVVAAK